MSAKPPATDPMPQVDHGDKALAPLIRIAQIQVDPKQLEQYREASRRIVEDSVAQEPGIPGFLRIGATRCARQLLRRGNLLR